MTVSSCTCCRYSSTLLPSTWNTSSYVGRSSKDCSARDSLPANQTALSHSHRPPDRLKESRLCVWGAACVSAACAIGSSTPQSADQSSHQAPKPFAVRPRGSLCFCTSMPFLCVKRPGPHQLEARPMPSHLRVLRPSCARSRVAASASPPGSILAAFALSSCEYCSTCRRSRSTRGKPCVSCTAEHCGELAHDES